MMSSLPYPPSKKNKNTENTENQQIAKYFDPFLDPYEVILTSPSSLIPKHS